MRFALVAQLISIRRTLCACGVGSSSTLRQHTPENRSHIETQNHCRENISEGSEKIRFRNGKNIRFLGKDVKEHYLSMQLHATTLLIRTGADGLRRGLWLAPERLSVSSRLESSQALQHA
jgi:hypothetical protein